MNRVYKIERDILGNGNIEIRFTLDDTEHMELLWRLLDRSPDYFFKLKTNIMGETRIVLTLFVLSVHSLSWTKKMEKFVDDTINAMFDSLEIRYNFIKELEQSNKH